MENEKCIHIPYIEYNFENLACLEKDMQRYKNNLLVRSQKCVSCSAPSCIKSIDGKDDVHFCNPYCMSEYKFSKQLP